MIVIKPAFFIWFFTTGLDYFSVRDTVCLLESNAGELLRPRPFLPLSSSVYGMSVSVAVGSDVAVSSPASPVLVAVPPVPPTKITR